MIPENMIGNKYNMLKVLSLDEKTTKLKSRKYLICQCDCGKIKSIRADAIGKIKSCGCIQRKIVSEYCKNNYKKYNEYDMDSEEYGIGYTSKGEKFIFDKEDYNKIKKYCWHVGKNGYLCAQYDNKQYLMHRIIMEEYIKSSKDVVDHIQHNKLDNRKKYLRIVSYSENNMNKFKLKNNTSGNTGISWAKEKQKWEVYIGINNKYIHLGRYDNYDDALNVRKEAEKKYFGKYSLDSSINIYENIMEAGEVDEVT